MKKYLCTTLLVFIVILIVACKKKKTEPPAPIPPTDYTKKMTGNRSYIGSYTYECWLCTPTQDTVIPQAMSKEFIVLSDSIIAYKSSPSYTFSYERYDTANNRLVFYADASGQDIFESESVAYYYLRDSITYYSMRRTSGDRRTYALHTE